jgi:hypothetical protein
MLKRREFITAAALIALTGPAFAQDAVDLAKAKSDGKVVWYTSTPLPQAQKIVNLFEKETASRSSCSAPAAPPSCAASSRRLTPAGSPPTC